MSWAAVASSKLKDALIWCDNAGHQTDCIPQHLPNGGNNQANSTIDAWVSGARDTLRNEFVYPAGGGHADWAGNQVISFKPGASPLWSMPKNTSMGYAIGTAANSPKNPDGTPASKHTYDSIVYMPTKDKFWCGGGIYWFTGNSSPQICWWWDPVAKTFTEKAVRPGGYGINTVWDDVGKRILIRHASTGLWAYNPDLEDAGPNPGAYTQLFTSSSGFTTMTSTLAINSAARLVYRIDPITGSNPGGGLKMIDLGNLTAKEIKLATTGDVEIESFAAGGLIYADNRLIGLGPSTLSAQPKERWAVYTADVKDRGGAGQPPIQWVRDPVDANEPVGQTHGTAAYRGIWKKFSGPYPNGKYYVTSQWDDPIWEYSPTWAATSVTLQKVTGLILRPIP